MWLAGSLLAEGPVPRLAETAGGSTAVRTMTAILPPPTEIAVGLGGWLDDTGLPDVFVGFEPLPGPPVDRPADPTARAIAAARRGQHAQGLGRDLRPVVGRDRVRRRLRATS